MLSGTSRNITLQKASWSRRDRSSSGEARSSSASERLCVCRRACSAACQKGHWRQFPCRQLQIRASKGLIRALSAEKTLVSPRQTIPFCAPSKADNNVEPLCEEPSTYTMVLSGCVFILITNRRNHRRHRRRPRPVEGRIPFHRPGHHGPFWTRRPNAGYYSIV